MQVSPASTSSARGIRSADEAGPSAAGGQDVRLDVFESEPSARMLRHRSAPGHLPPPYTGQASGQQDQAEPQAPVGPVRGFCRRLWASPALRFVPVYAAIVTSIGGYYSLRNYLFLTEAKTFGALKSLRPLLLGAHNEILCELGKVLQKLNGTDNSTDCSGQ